MYCVQIYGLHVYCALVDLDSSGSPGVRPTSGLTSSTQVVCVCVRAYTSTHPPTTLTPVKIEKYTRQTPYLYPCQNITSHENNKRWAWKPPNYNPLLHTHASVEKTPVIHTHIVEGLDSTKKQIRLHECICTPTRMCIYMYMHIYTQTHMYAYTYICTCTYTRIHERTYTHTCTRTSIHKQKILATTPQRIKSFHRSTFVSIYLCRHIHIYMHIHICAQLAVNVSQMRALMSKEDLYSPYNCTCTGAQNTCKVLATITAK